jgi:hypothetical protein
MGFEPTIPASERAKTVHALDGAASVFSFAMEYSGIRFTVSSVELFNFFKIEVETHAHRHKRAWVSRRLGRGNGRRGTHGDLINVEAVL